MKQYTLGYSITQFYGKKKLTEEYGRIMIIEDEYQWVCKKSEHMYASPYVNVHVDKVHLPNGTSIEYTRVDRLPFVIIVPQIAEKCAMIYNYRYPINTFSLEFPAGHIENNETPKQAARRELKEETGYIAEELKIIGWYHPSISRGRQKAWIAHAKVKEKTNTKRDETETQQNILLKKNIIYNKIIMGDITHAASIIAFFRTHEIR